MPKTSRRTKALNDLCALVWQRMGCPSMKDARGEKETKGDKRMSRELNGFLQGFMSMAEVK